MTQTCFIFMGFFLKKKAKKLKLYLIFYQMCFSLLHNYIYIAHILDRLYVFFLLGDSEPCINYCRQLNLSVFSDAAPW